MRRHTDKNKPDAKRIAEMADDKVIILRRHNPFDGFFHIQRNFFFKTENIVLYNPLTVIIRLVLTAIIILYPKAKQPGVHFWVKRFIPETVRLWRTVRGYAPA